MEEPSLLAASSGIQFWNAIVVASRLVSWAAVQLWNAIVGASRLIRWAARPIVVASRLVRWVASLAIVVASRLVCWVASLARCSRCCRDALVALRQRHSMMGPMVGEIHGPIPIEGEIDGRIPRPDLEARWRAWAKTAMMLAKLRPSFGNVGNALAEFKTGRQSRGHPWSRLVRRRLLQKYFQGFWHDLGSKLADWRAVLVTVDSRARGRRPVTLS